MSVAACGRTVTRAESGRGKRSRVAVDELSGRERAEARLDPVELHGPHAGSLVPDRDHADRLVAPHHEEGGTLAVSRGGIGGEVGGVGGDIRGVNMKQVLQEGVLRRNGDDLVDLGVIRLAVQAQQPVDVDDRDGRVHRGEGPHFDDGVVDGRHDGTDEVHPTEPQYLRLGERDDDEDGTDPSDGFQQGMHPPRVGGGPTLEA